MTDKQIIETTTFEKYASPYIIMRDINETNEDYIKRIREYMEKRNDR